MSHKYDYSVSRHGEIKAHNKCSDAQYTLCGSGALVSSRQERESNGARCFCVELIALHIAACWTWMALPLSLWDCRETRHTWVDAGKHMYTCARDESSTSWKLFIYINCVKIKIVTNQHYAAPSQREPTHESQGAELLTHCSRKSIGEMDLMVICFSKFPSKPLQWARMCDARKWNGKITPYSS